MEYLDSSSLDSSSIKRAFGKGDKAREDTHNSVSSWFTVTKPESAKESSINAQSDKTHNSV